MKLAVQKNHLGGQILYGSPNPDKNVHTFLAESTVTQQARIFFAKFQRNMAKNWRNLA